MICEAIPCLSITRLSHMFQNIRRDIFGTIVCYSIYNTLPTHIHTHTHALTVYTLRNSIEMLHNSKRQGASTV